MSQDLQNYQNMPEMPSNRPSNARKIGLLLVSLLLFSLGATVFIYMAVSRKAPSGTNDEVGSYPTPQVAGATATPMQPDARLFPTVAPTYTPLATVKATPTQTPKAKTPTPTASATKSPSPTPTPTPIKSSSPNPSPTTKPTSTPNPSFIIPEGGIKAYIDQPSHRTTTCPQTFTFNVEITVENAPGTVHYYFIRSEGGNQAEQTLFYSENGTKLIKHTWEVNKTTNGWVKFEATSPNRAYVNNMTFSLVCQ